VKVEQLPSGDYVLGEIAIERKSYANFNHDLSFRKEGKSPVGLRGSGLGDSYGFVVTMLFYL